jgi:hypothetical protein
VVTGDNARKYKVGRVMDYAEGLPYNAKWGYMDRLI